MAILTPSLEQALPAGYTARPAVLADVEATVAMLNAASQALSGADEHTAADWRSEFQAPGFDPAERTRLLLAPDGTVAGFAEVWASPPFTLLEQWGCVDPAHTGRGLGTHLLSWTESVTRRLAAQAPAPEPPRLQTWVNARNATSRSLVSAHGFKLVRHFLRMAIELDEAAPPAAPAWPAGVCVRAFVPGQDDDLVYRVIRASFKDSWDFVEQPFDEGLQRFQHFYQHSEQFDSSLWFLAVTGAGADESVVGTTFVRLSMPEDPDRAWIRTIGVLPEWRRRGIAEALLRHALSELYRRGRRKAALGVDAASPTGATRLYEKAGMHAVEAKTEQVWEKTLANEPGPN